MKLLKPNFNNLKMLGDLSFVIIREIIKRIDDYRSIDNLINLNYRFKNLIINDNICQEYYLKIRYYKLKIKSDNIKEIINVLNSKRYSRFFQSEINENQQNAIFARPSDDAFIIYYQYNYAPFIINTLEIRHIIRKIFDEKLENMEEILNRENFFLLEYRISKKFIEKIIPTRYSLWVRTLHDDKIKFNVLYKRYNNFLSEFFS